MLERKENLSKIRVWCHQGNWATKKKQRGPCNGLTKEIGVSQHKGGTWCIKGGGGGQTKQRQKSKSLAKKYKKDGGKKKIEGSLLKA